MARVASDDLGNRKIRIQMNNQYTMTAENKNTNYKMFSYRWHVALSIILQSFRWNTTVGYSSNCSHETPDRRNWLRTLYMLYFGIQTMKPFIDLERHSRSLAMAQLIIVCRNHVSFHVSSGVVLICSTLNNGVPLKYGLGFFQGHWTWHHSIDHNI